MLTNLVLQLGLTRDSLWWFWSRLVSGATIIFGAVALGGHTFLDTYLTGGQIKTVTIAAVVVLWLAGKFDSSPLPGAKKE